MATAQEMLETFQIIADRGESEVAKLSPEQREVFDILVDRNEITYTPAPVEVEATAPAEPVILGDTVMTPGSGDWKGASIPSDDDIFFDLSPEAIETIKEQTFREPVSRGEKGSLFSYNSAGGMDRREAMKLANMARLRAVNPYLAESISSMDPMEAYNVGAGAFMAKMGEGAGLKEPDPEGRKAFETMTGIRDEPGFAETAVDIAASTYGPGRILSGIPGRGWRVFAGGMMEGEIENIRSQGEYVPDEERLIRAGLATVLGSAGSYFVPGPMSTAQKEIATALEFSAPSTTLDKLNEALRQGATDDELMEIITTPVPESTAGARSVDLGQNHPTIQNIVDLVENGQRPRDAVTASIQGMNDILTENKLAGYIRTGAGEIRTDPMAREAVRQGFDQGTVQAIVGASDVDRDAFSKMLDIFKKARSNTTYAQTNRPADIIGDTLQERISFITSVKDSAGREIDVIAREVGDTTVSTADFTASYLDDLADEGIGFTPEGLEHPLSSTFARNEPAKKALDDMFEQVKFLQENPTFMNLHRTKRMIDDMVEYGRRSSEGLTGRAEGIIKKLRYQINKQLSEADERYAAANNQFYTAKDAIDSFQSSISTKVDMAGPNADKALGTAARTLTSNRATRIPMLDALKKFDDIVYGLGMRPEDDLIAQNMFVNLLESRFGAVGDTSIGGIMANNMERIAKNQRSGLIDAGIEMAVEGGKTVAGLTDEGAIRALENLLK